ncbi:MAG: leucine-rich repeat protein, partial [Firmicutes bacterium]|nr:leucine-rich repeat protein [Candidatus Colimorpha enterica]
MKRKMFRTALAVLFIILSILLVSCANNAKDYRVRVIIQDNEGITVKSPAKVDVMPGTSAEFEIAINEGFAYVGNNLGAEYDEASGKLILKNVFYPSTLMVEVKPNDDLIHLSTGSNSEKCTISVVSGKEYFAVPSDVTVKVEYEDGETFSGWSLGGLLIEGAKLLGTEKEITVHVTETSTLYANFASDGGYSIVYHLNGGHVADSEKDTYVVYGEYNDLFAMQQTLESNGTFVRDGYVAIGYSTTPAEYAKYKSVNDIPGFSNMGGVCSVPATNKLDLYVVWAKETPAEKFTFKNGTITGFAGGADYVVIPETIEGQTVKKIKSGVFTNNLAITNVVIPRTVEEVQNDAFKNCLYLREVVFFDSLLTVSDASFNGSERNLKTVCLNAARLPKYSGSAEGSFC